MPIRYDRGIGANIYDPSGMNEASQGNAMAALARALGYTNEASGLGLSATFGGPQMAAQGLQDLVQTEQQARQLQNQRELMVMQMAGQAAIEQARLEQSAQQAAAQRDLTMWGKQGDWQRYDKQMQTQKDVAQSNKIADFMKAYYGEQGKNQRAAETNQRMQDIANQRDATQREISARSDQTRKDIASKPQKFPEVPKDLLPLWVSQQKERLRKAGVPPDKWPSDIQIAADLTDQWRQRFIPQQGLPSMTQQAPPEQPVEAWDGFGPDENPQSVAMQRMLGIRNGW